MKAASATFFATLPPVARFDANTSHFSFYSSDKAKYSRYLPIGTLIAVGFRPNRESGTRCRVKATAEVEAVKKGEGNGLANPTVVGGGRAGAGRVHFSRTPGRVNLLDGYQEHTGRKQLGKRLVESAQLCNFTIVMLRLELRG